MIGCRIGDGRNIFGPAGRSARTNMHIGCWRFEPDLGDPVNKVGGPKDNGIALVGISWTKRPESYG